MEPPGARTYGGLVREMAARYPSRPAMIFGGATTSFRQLDQDVDAVSRGLLALDVRRGDVVSVLAGNRPEWLTCVFGAARIGAVVAPINTWYQADELRHQLRHAEVRVLFTVGRLLRHDYAERLQRIVPALGEPRRGPLRDPELPSLRHVVQLDEQTLPGAMSFQDFVAAGTDPTAPPLAEAEAQVRPDDVVYMLYTSGSTAAPKGVVLHHGDAIENDFHIGERQHLEPADRLWSATPMFYAFAAINAVPAAWTHGACLLLQETFDAGRALELIERERATVFYGQGHVTRALLGHPDFADRDLSSLRKGVISRSREDKRLTLEVLGVSRACSMYGLTETYGHCAITDADDSLEIKLETQGRPLPGWEFRVVDVDSGHELPTDSVGELRLRGRVTSGYYRDPEQTAAAFDSDGWFRTGDIVRIGRDGRLRFVSRHKELIKVAGINVAPSEVEELLVSHPHIRHAQVVGLPDEARGEIIAAFVEPTVAALRAEEVQAFVRSRAASFKTPSVVLFRDERDLPRGATGKVPARLLVAEALRELGRDAPLA